jgi:hypothetical protein
VGRARAADQEDLLTAVVSRVRETPGAVVVFDLDSTLLDNRPRQALILRDYGEAAGLPALRAASPRHWQGWDLGVALSNAGLPPEVVERHAEAARRFWRERFFTSAYCRHDAAVPGAPAFTRALEEGGAILAYVTGRPAAMREGTLHAFGRHGFPLPDGDGVHLLMKDDPGMLDDDWKERARVQVERLGPVVAAFDNEPAHVNLYARAWPRSLCIHLDTDHSGRPVEVIDRVPSVRDFLRTGRGPA